MDHEFCFYSGREIEKIREELKKLGLTNSALLEQDHIYYMTNVQEKIVSLLFLGVDIDLVNGLNDYENLNNLHDSLSSEYMIFNLKQTYDSLLNVLTMITTWFFCSAQHRHKRLCEGKVRLQYERRNFTGRFDLR